MCTGYNTLPLIRYEIGDHGGVLEYDELVRRLGRRAKMMLRKYPAPELPAVFVYERADFSTKLCGAIIYPEHIREALGHQRFERYVTGKCTIMTKHDKQENQYLEIHVELVRGALLSDELKQEIARAVTAALVEKNAEYAYLHALMPQKVEPVFVFWEYEHALYFKPQGKQKWIVRTNA